MSQENHTILLYYLYADIERPHELMKAHKEFCAAHELTGRIIIAKEGINGTVEGTIKKIELYKKWLTGQHKDFKNIDFKKSPSQGDSFPKLSVKVRDEIVSLHLGENDIDPRKTTGKYLSADELHQWYLDGKEFYIVDMRNDYEYVVGHFKNSFLFKGMENFRDLPECLPEIEHLRNKTVVTVCTGGIRCEKASGFLVKNGFKEVYQLLNGMHTYMEKYPDGFFKGSLYVFDGRVTLAFNTSEDREIIGTCFKCDTKSENYVNCVNLGCHDHIICCEACVEATGGTPFCSKKCEKAYMLAIA